MFIPIQNVKLSSMVIPVLNGALWDMEQVHYEICENGLLAIYIKTYPLLS